MEILRYLFSNSPFQGWKLAQNVKRSWEEIETKQFETESLSLNSLSSLKTAAPSQFAWTSYAMTTYTFFAQKQKWL